MTVKSIAKVALVLTLVTGVAYAEETEDTAEATAKPESVAAPLPGIGALNMDAPPPGIGAPPGAAPMGRVAGEPPTGFQGPLAKVGEALDRAGIELDLTYLDIYQNAPNFGFAGGSSGNFGAFIAAAKLNLNEHLRFNITETVNRPVHNVDNYMFEISNAFFPLPVVDSATDLTRFTIAVDSPDHRVTVEAGRLPFALDVARGKFCSGFGCVNSSKAINLNSPGETLSVWGAKLTYKLDPDTRLNFAIAEDNEDNWQNGNGWDWGKGKATGTYLLANLYHDENPMTTAYPLRYEVGAVYRSSPYEDALYNSGFGNPGFPVAPTVEEHDGMGMIYGQIRKTVWDQDPLTPAGKQLTVYGGLFNTVGSGVSYPWEAYAGVEYSGFLPQNPMFTVGTTLHYIQLSKKRAAYERNARRFISGIDESQPRDTFQIDLHAWTPIGDSAFIEATAAYIINPNTTVLSDFSSARLNDDWVFGINFAWQFGKSLGLTRRGRS
ncbi:MAG: carbohydrate porin [Rhodobacteraceae bacterium]|nr:carbohydrate porin [Paracoccaceae bacterium]